MEKKKEPLETGFKDNLKNGIPNMDDEEEIEEKPPEKVPEITLKRHSIVNKDLCKAFAGVIPFLLLAQTTGNKNYILNDTEKETLAPLWDDIFNKYLPGFMVDFQEEFMLATAIGIICLSKSNFIKNLSEKKPAEEKTNINTTEEDITNF